MNSGPENIDCVMARTWTDAEWTKVVRPLALFDCRELPCIS